MCFACKTETRCDHPVKDCPAVEGEYCVTCHHDSSVAQPPRRKSASLGPREGWSGTVGPLARDTAAPRPSELIPHVRLLPGGPHV
jgi:hypothetical protein